MDNSTQEATTSVEDSDEDDELRELLAQLFALRVLRQARCPCTASRVCVPVMWTGWTLHKSL